MEEPEKPAVIDLQKLLNTRVVVHVRDGRKLSGTLTQYDEYMNMLLEDVDETMRDKPANKYKLLVIKGGNVQAISV
jgi:small nuclear ribonucleoprotein (snRNP)-like protein